MRLRLRELRKAQGLTQKELTRAAGVQQGAVGKWERGENQLKLTDAAMIADLLGCSIDDLVGCEPRELSYESRQHERLETSWASFNQTGKAKLLEYARLLVMDENNTRKR